jgi:3-hydroxyisobutyrate dehydrogenase-like beta-hydroxyacid dehydrogenase
MVGGTDHQFDAIKPLLSRMGTNVIHAGQAGSGHAVKGLNNLLAATILVATGEVFNAGTKFGLDPRVMQQIVSASSGGSFMSSIVWPKAIIPETWDFGFTTQLMKKDVDIGMSILQAMGMKATVSSKSAAVWSDALSMMGSNTDMTEVVKFLRKSD